MTALLPVNVSPFGHHHHQSKVSSLIAPLKPRPLVFSTSTSISLPILCLDRFESFPIKSTGSLPDLSMMVSAAAESRHRASSLNGTFSTSLPSSSPLSSAHPLTPTHPLSLSKSNSSECSISLSSQAMTVSKDPNPTTSAYGLTDNSGDLNNNFLCNGTNQTKDESSGSMEASTPEHVPASGPIAADPVAVPTSPGRRRKNSSMAPVVPDLELMAQLRQEDEQKESQAKTNGENGSHSDMNGHNGLNGADLDALSDFCDHEDWIGAERHENAATWLAAAMKNRSPQSRRKNGVINGIAQATVASALKLTSTDTKMCLCPEIKVASIPSTPQYKPIMPTGVPSLAVKNDAISPVVTPASTDKPKLLQPFKDERVRRTSSILRPQANLVTLPVQKERKKKVSFADTLGMQLENVRYFANSPTVTRRFSSYHAPTSTYLTNGNYNSPWNMAINGNRTPLGTNNSVNVPQANPVKDYDFSHAKLAPRYELVAANFASPSLQLNFTQHLEAQSVLLHSLTTAETTVYGTVSVMNLHFSKRVYVRYTFNEWKTHIEREATYMLGSHDGRTDKFSFVIYARPEDFCDNLAAAFSVHHSGTYLANSQNTVQSMHPRVYFALRFTTGDGKEYWDNNDGRNYCLNLNTY